MRKPSTEELQAIARLYKLPQEQREIEQSQQRAIIALGQPLPVIHQVLFS